MKYLLCISKEHNNFSYLWTFKPNMPNSFGEIIFEKFLHRMFELINCFATQQFRSFVLLLFPLLLVANSWNLQKMPKLTCSVTFKPIMYVRRRLLWAKWNKDSLMLFSRIRLGGVTLTYKKSVPDMTCIRDSEFAADTCVSLKWDVWHLKAVPQGDRSFCTRWGRRGGLKKLHAPPLS